MAPRVEEHEKPRPAPADTGVMLNNKMNLNEDSAQRYNSYLITGVSALALRLVCCSDPLATTALSPK